MAGRLVPLDVGMSGKEETKESLDNAVQTSLSWDMPVTFSGRKNR